MPLASTDILDPSTFADWPLRRPSSYSCPPKCTSLLSTWQSSANPEALVVAEYYMALQEKSGFADASLRTTQANPRSIPRRILVHSHGLHPSSPFYSSPLLSSPFPRFTSSLM
ncbi:hypothetical protein B0H13DRAFT_2384950 [Mycena leptocephala]|nr:hypothetical protein B0H13DRAFT_2384950 [Mycena leptocephala]